ncbi:major facilitator superfamily domain-containing protein [Mycena galopus ATCC 62051]|nr:major facilitator superfamily domain-containing protein [Mycena galopus ATCC 62051]
MAPRTRIDAARLSTDASSDDQKETPVSLGTDHPDGGLKAWIVLFGTATGTFATFGSAASWGVFQAYYKQTVLRDWTPSEMPIMDWHALMYFPALLVGRLFDIGHFRIPFITGSLLIVLSTFLVPECKVYWHFMLCQGFGAGIGSGMTYSTMLTLVTHWFSKRRGLALGLTTFGAAVGATVQPIILRQLINKVGFPWAMRSLGFILFFLLLITNLCIARRLSPVKASGGMLGLHIFRNKTCSVFTLSACISCLGLLTSAYRQEFITSLSLMSTVSTYISISAIAFGISPNLATYLVAIANMSSGVGRVTSGLLGDRFGPLNIMTIMTVLTGVATIAWPFCRTIPRIIGISVLYGFSSGAWPALIGASIGQMGGMEDIGRRIGTVLTVAGITVLCGPPVSGVFADSRLGYIAVGYFAAKANMLLAYIYILAVGSIAVTAKPFYEPPALVSRQACAGMNLNCTCECTCGEGYICCCD